VYLRFALNPVHIIDGLYLGGKTILTMRDRYNLAFTFAFTVILRIAGRVNMQERTIKA